MCCELACGFYESVCPLYVYYYYYYYDYDYDYDYDLYNSWELYTRCEIKFKRN